VKCDYCGKEFRTQNIKRHQRACKKRESVFKGKKEVENRNNFLEKRLSNLEKLFSEKFNKTDSREDEILEKKYIKLFILFILELKDNIPIEKVKNLFKSVGISDKIINNILLNLFASNLIDFSPKVSVSLENLIKLLWNKKLINSFPLEFEISTIKEILTKIPSIKHPKEYLDTIINENRDFLILTGTEIGDFESNLIIKGIWNSTSNIKRK
jgi:hypothetical protein